MNTEHYLDAILALPDMLEVPPQVSRDGKWVAWTWTNAGPSAEIYVAPTDGSHPPIQLTNTGEDSYLASWTPDSRAVIFFQDKDGDERYRLYRVELEDKRLTPLTQADPPYFLHGGQLHPNAQWLVYGMNFDADTQQELEPTWIYRQDLHNGERKPLARPLRPGYTDPQLSSNGEWILYRRKDLHPAGVQIWLVDIHGQHDRELINVGPDKKVFASWFPGSDGILVLAETPTHTRLGVWEMATEKLRWLLDDPSRDLQDAYVPFGSQQIVLLENKRGRTSASFLDPESGAETPLSPEAGTLIPLAPRPDGAWVGVIYSARQPTDLVAFSPHPGSSPTLTSLARIWESTPLTPTDFTSAEDFTWRSVDGLEIHGWLYRAAGEAIGTVIYVHGGPTWHSQDIINPQIQYLVQCGFNVLDPNYRGSTGYGLPFREAIRIHGWGGLEQDDVRTGIQALLSAGIAQPGKVGITGTSYGGYTSWWAITHFSPEVVSAAAPICGMTDLVVDYETTRPDIRPYSEEMMGGSPQQVPQRYFERSPINFIPQIRGRLLIVQGGRDPNVTPENVRLVIEKLQAAGVPYELQIFDDEGHGIAKPANQRVLYWRLGSFFMAAFD